MDIIIQNDSGYIKKYEFMSATLGDIVPFFSLLFKTNSYRVIFICILHRAQYIQNKYLFSSDFTSQMLTYTRFIKTEGGKVVISKNIIFCTLFFYSTFSFLSHFWLVHVTYHSYIQPTWTICFLKNCWRQFKWEIIR